MTAESARAQELHRQATVAIAHDHAMYSLAARRSRGERATFSSYYAPLARQGGVNVIGLVVGGDPPLLGIDPIGPWWGSLALFDMLWQEAEESADSFTICLNCQDIDEAVAGGKIAVLAMMEGGQALSEGPHPESLVSLRTLYRLGLRGLQLVGQAWNRTTDGSGDESSSHGLTRFGERVIREMNRLGMVIDLAHLPDPDPLFRDVVELSQDPVIDSHRCARGATDIPRNMSDERIRAIAAKGGVIGLQFFSSVLTSDARHQGTVDDLVRHMDHVVEVAGIECVALGPDFLETALTDRGPDHYARGIDDIAKLPHVTEALVRHGYSDSAIRAILGDNLLRVYR